MKTNKCLRCGHEWVSRIDNPLTCPRCKLYNWKVLKSIKSNREVK